MTTIDLKKERWKAYFETLTRVLEGKQALVEVAALPLGDQVAVKWLPLRGATYDHKDDLLDLDLGDVGHVIRRPAAIYLEVEGSEVRTIEVIDANDVKHIVRLRERLVFAHIGRPTIRAIDAGARPQFGELARDGQIFRPRARTVVPAPQLAGLRGFVWSRAPRAWVHRSRRLKCVPRQ